MNPYGYNVRGGYIYRHEEFLGIWRGMVFYPMPDYAKEGIPITLLQFLVELESK